MDSRKDKATVQGGQVDGSHANAKSTGADYTTIGAIANAQRAIWLLSYRLEEAYQCHADAGHLWRQAGCCIALSIFRTIGDRI